MSKLPFVRGLFFKTLGVVVVLVVVTWTLVLWLTDYELIPADYGGTLITTVLLAYLIHLWIMPMDEANPDESHPDEGE